MTQRCLWGRLHAEIEDHLAASGLAYTLLRPASFANNLLYAAKSVAKQNSWSGAVMALNDLGQSCSPNFLTWWRWSG
jgi:hypothetical protein